MVPFEMQNFPEAGTSEYQQTQCGGGVWPDDWAAVSFLRRVLGFWVRLIDRIGQPARFGFPDGLTDPRQFRGRQIPFAALFWKMFDPPTRVAPRGNSIC